VEETCDVCPTKASEQFRIVVPTDRLHDFAATSKASRVIHRVLLKYVMQITYCKWKFTAILTGEFRVSGTCDRRA
jgi:hypothetical protein